MDWDKLYKMQEQLDNYIEAHHDLEGTNIFEARYLALLVELGELANETRCFKFWSNKPKNADHVILEEFVDNLHFLLSLGLEKGFRYSGGAAESKGISETEQFTKIFASCVSFKMDPTKQRYNDLFRDYLKLADLLGFSEADIYQAYFEKNKINYERQDQGY